MFADSSMIPECEGLEHSLSFLADHVPDKYWVETLRLRSDKNRRDLQHRVVLAARSIMLRPDSLSPDWPTIKRLFGDGVDKIDSRSQMFVSLLFDQIFGNTDEFVRATIENRCQPWFTTLARTSIPCLHGFFSTGELIQQAHIFYQQAVVSWPADDKVLQLVRPFFVGPSVFPFFESVIPQFCDLFVSFNKERGLQNFEPETTEFIRLVQLHSPVISREHRVLYQLLEHRYEGPAKNFLLDIVAEFFRLFVKYRADQQRASLWVKRLLSHWRSHDDGKAVRLALSGAFGGSTVSVFEVPSIFALEPSIHYILTRHELVPLVEVAKGMPSLAGDVASIEAQLPHVEAALAFNYFKRPGLAVRRDDPPLFFGEDFHVDWEHSRELSRDIYLGVGSDERCRAYSLRERIRSLAASADAFEQYLLSREVYHRTKRWAAVLSSFQRCIYSPLIQGADPAHGRTSVEMVARLAFTKSERLQRELVIAWLEPQIEDRLRSDPSLWRNLDALKAQWLSNLRFSEARGNPTDMLSTAVLSSAFVNCVDRLGRFDQETLSGRFALVIETTAILSTLSELEKQKYAHTLMTLAVRLSASCEFARFYYIVSTYVLVDLDIQATCTEKDLTAWFVFETAILSLIHDHPSLATLFYTISNSSTSRTLA